MAFDERAFIRRVEAAGPDEFATLLRHPAPEEEAALRVHLGDERYRRMHELALTAGPTRRGALEPRGNVILIHGIMGGELTATRGADGVQVWAKVLRLITGGIAQLRLAANGRDEFDADRTVAATGIMKKHYGEMILALASRWNAHTFWFDWRRDLSSAAALLGARATEWFGADAPFHIVAHSMGGLVARTFILEDPARWAAMRTADPGLDRGGRLIMLGTPNHGSFAIPQIFTGLEGMIRKLSLIDLKHGRDELVEIVNGFPGSYQMLPSPYIDEKWARLYEAETYEPFEVSQDHLDAALRHHDALRHVIDPERMVYIAGCDQPTLADVDADRVTDGKAYRATFDGDGRVPHRLGLLEGVRTRYVVEDHGALPHNGDVLATIHELIETGDTSGLLERPVRRRAADPEAAARALAEAEARDEREIEAYLHRTRRVRASDSGEPRYLSADERAVEDLLTRGFLSAPDERTSVVEPTPASSREVPRLRVRLVAGDIQDAGTDDDANPDDLPIDAIAVGHYRGVKPEAAELALDRAISRTLAGTPDGTKVPERELVLTQLTERGTIAGGLGQPFLLRDPRIAINADRVRSLAIAGMGLPGSFGAPELSVLVRELAWALGRTGHRHLATVLIGAGNGNIPIFMAVRTWIQALGDGLVGENPERTLACVTFVERDPGRVVEIDAALLHAVDRYPALISVDYTPLSNEDRAALEARAEKNEADRERERLRKAREDRSALGDADLPPTRVTFTLDGRTYRMGAITNDAAIPERDVPLDPALVRDANDELAGEGRLEMQVERGRFMQRLIVPRELRDRLTTAAPLVLIVDATTARVHWEMVAQPQLAGRPAVAGESVENQFLGTARGLTRQLRTGFAPPPEPPPPPRRTLRVLIVADPAADDHLPGAEEEGMAVARLFESFNRIYQSDDNRVEVVRLFGPSEATRTNVLRTIMAESFDVLHYAGHCQYDEEDPARSGWIFTGGEVLSAHELNRIDRIPKFVFSNACESGITPDRSEKRTAALAPGFAEAFFARGVANFVCTAWPVDDLAARVFSLRLYGQLLGVEPAVDAPRGTQPVGRDTRLEEGPQPMHLAMNRARLAIMRTPNGVRTWGAYQHYGNPYFRLFDAHSLRTPAPTS